MSEPIIDGVPAGSLPANTAPLTDASAAPAVNADAEPGRRAGRRRSAAAARGPLTLEAVRT